MENVKIILLLAVLSFYSCSSIPYFEQPDTSVVFDRHMGRETDLATFSFELQPYKFFKNGNITLSLFSENSYFIKDNRHFVYEGKGGDFDKHEHSWRDDIFYTAKLYGVEDGLPVLKENKPIMLITSQMKKIYDEKGNLVDTLYRTFKIFKGSVVKQQMIDNKDYHIVFIDTIYEGRKVNSKSKAGKLLFFNNQGKYGKLNKLDEDKIINNNYYVNQDKANYDKQAKSKEKQPSHNPHKNHENVILALVIGDEGNKLIIKAIVDVNYHKESTSSDMYDLNEILKDDIWMIKQN